MSNFTFDLSGINRGLEQYMARVRVAIRRVAEYYAPILELSLIHI
jgi:hypothetical protein